MRIKLTSILVPFLINLCFVQISCVDKNFHSDRTKSPYSTLEGSTIRIKPYDASFEIPAEWTIPQKQKNLFLSSQEMDSLDEVKENGIRFDDENGEVIDSILPFEHCAAHVGDKSWNNSLWNDLQARVYIVEMTPNEFNERVRNEGLNKARSVFEKADLSSEIHDGWQKYSLDILDAPTHFMLNKKIDFYYRNFQNQSVVFVFVHAGGFDETIDQMLKSFKPGSVLSSS